MANQIKQVNVIDTNSRALIKYIIIGDGTNSANTIILDPAKLNFAKNANSLILGTGTDRKSKYNYTIRRVYGNAKIGGYIKIGFQEDGNTDAVLITSGQFDYGIGPGGDAVAIKSVGANSSGNLVMTVVGSAANDAAMIFIDIKKDAADFDIGSLRDPAAFGIPQ